MNRIWRDRQFLAAFLVPSLLLLAARLCTGAGLDSFVWPLQQPGRFFGLVLLWPVMEEIVFRGALQPRLTGSRWGGLRLVGVTAGNGVTSLLFAAAHLFAHPPLWAALVVLPSLLFGYFRDRHDCLLPPVFLHIAYNLGYYWFFGGA